MSPDVRHDGCSRGPALIAVLHWLSLATAALAWPGAGIATAQSSLQVPIQFDFLDPGAKSLALGSAFVGLADDATATLANPAGLVQLVRPEISAEGRFRAATQPFLSRGRLSGIPTGIGQDTIAGPVFDEISSHLFGLGFISFVYPARRVAVAFYRHEPLRVEQTFESDGVFQFRPPSSESRDTAFTGERTIRIDNYGGSVAVPFGPRLSLGAGLSIYTFELGFDFRRYLHKDNDFYGAPDPALEIFRFTQAGDASGVAGNIGLLFSATPNIKVGAVFKRGPRFTFTSTSSGLAGTQLTESATFHVPDTFAVGVSARPTETLLVTVQYNRVMHSDLQHGYIDVLVNQPGSRERADRFSIADSNEFHLGSEYVLSAVKTAPGLRAGIWRDPDHSVRYAASPANDFLDERMTVALGRGGTEWHYTFGAGASVNRHFEWSFGADVTSSTSVTSASAIFRF